MGIRTMVFVASALAALVAATAGHSRSQAGTIDIGWVGDQSGPTVVSQAPVLHAMQAYFRMVNDAGGIKGRNINFIVKDDGYNAANEISQVKSLISDGVPLIVGLSTSSGIQSVVPVLTQSKTVGFFTQANSKELSYPFQKWAIEGNCNLSDQADVGLGYMLVRLKRKDLRGLKVGIVAIAVASGEEWTSVAKQHVEKLGGTTVTVPLPASVISADVQVLQLQQEKVDFILFHHTQTGAVGLLRSMAKFNFLIPVLSSYGATGDVAFTNSPYEASKNYFGLNCFTPPPIGKSATAKQAVTIGEKYGYPAAEINQINWALGWSQAALITDGLRKVQGEYTGDSVLAGLESVRKLETGLAPTLSLSSKCHMANRMVRPYTYSYKTKTMQPVGSYESWAKYITNAYVAPGTCGKPRGSS